MARDKKRLDWFGYPSSKSDIAQAKIEHEEEINRLRQGNRRMTFGFVMVLTIMLIEVVGMFVNFLFGLSFFLYTLVFAIILGWAIISIQIRLNSLLITNSVLHNRWLMVKK